MLCSKAITSTSQLWIYLRGLVLPLKDTVKEPPIGGDAVCVLEIDTEIDPPLLILYVEPDFWEDKIVDLTSIFEECFKF